MLGRDMEIPFGTPSASAPARINTGARSGLAAAKAPV